jgi:ribosomal protein S18 acetylase RimI-like enzyme
MVSFQMRPYNELIDFSLVRDFFIAMGTDAQRTGTWHLGNLVIGLYFETMALHDIQLWHDRNGVLIGLGWYDIGSGWLGMQLHRQWRERADLKTHILAWGEQQAFIVHSTKAPHRLQVVVHEHDSQLLALVASGGFERDTFTLLRMQHALAAPLAPSRLPDGWNVRHVQGANEAPTRAGVYQTVWGQPTRDLAGYLRMQQAADYRPELDVVVVAPSGDFIAFCQCWFDSVNQTGLIEPMGTVPAFRRGGYGRAALMEGIRRLHALGAQQVFVTVDADVEPARQLYERAGFQTVSTEYHFTKAQRETVPVE